MQWRIVMKLGLLAALIVGLFTFQLVAQNPCVLKDVYPGSASAFFSGTNVTVTRAVLGDRLYFSADDGATGQELFSSVSPFDAGSTGLLKEVTAGTAGISQAYHAAYDKLFFAAPVTDVWQGVYRSDGTLQGTALLYSPSVKKNTAFRILNRFIRSSQGGIFFSAYSSRLGTPVLDYTGYYYKTNPVSGASVLLKSGGSFQHLTDLNGTMVCFEWNWPWANTGYCKLYRSNGTSKGTKAYYDMPMNAIVTPQPYPGTPHVYSDGWLRKYVGGNNLFFEFNEGTAGSELWKTDGTAAGTMRVTDINPGTGHSSPTMFAVMGEYLYFSANDGAHGWQIWRYPVAGSGTAERVTDINGTYGGADPMWLTNLNGTLLFSAYMEDSGRELWKSNGLPLGGGAVYSRVSDIYPGPGSSNPNYAEYRVNGVNTVDTDEKYRMNMAVLNGWVYFPADDGNGYALWRSDGTSVEKLGSVNPFRLTPMSWIENNHQRNLLFFIAWSDAAGYELWKFDPDAQLSPKLANNSGMPAGFSLSQNYPNPFNPSTLIRYEIPEAGHVSMVVYDLFGRRVTSLVEGVRPSGMSSVVFRFDGLPSGVYTYVLESGGAALARVMTLVK
jgi:ELWxxDGT repeat protein